VRYAWIVSLLVALMLCTADHTPAQDTRIAAFALHCFIPLRPGLHTRAVLEGEVAFAQRTVRFTATCFDGPSASVFPEFQVHDGPVQSIDVSVVTALENGDRQVVAQNRCWAASRNGFLTFRCLASEGPGGEVDVLVSIEPLKEKGPSEVATP
jgi:hypothetical protein